MSAIVPSYYLHVQLGASFAIETNRDVDEHLGEHVESYGGRYYSAGKTDRLPLSGTARTMFWTYIALFSVPCIKGKRELLLMASYAIMREIRYLCRAANTFSKISLSTSMPCTQTTIIYM